MTVFYPGRSTESGNCQSIFQNHLKDHNSQFTDCSKVTHQDVWYLKFFFSIECSRNLNMLTGPRIVILVLHCLFLLLQYSWFLLTLSLSFTSWLLRARLRVVQGNFGVYDPTKIHVRENLRNAIKESLVYMAYHMASFFIYMWLLVSSIPESNASKPAIQSEVPWWLWWIYFWCDIL